MHSLSSRLARPEVLLFQVPPLRMQEHEARFCAEMARERNGGGGEGNERELIHVGQVVCGTDQWDAEEPPPGAGFAARDRNVPGSCGLLSRGYIPLNIEALHPFASKGMLGAQYVLGRSK